MVTRTEYAITKRLDAALEAYGLTPGEVDAQVTSIQTVTNGRHILGADGLEIILQAQKVIDPRRASEVNRDLHGFVDTFVRESGLDRDKCVDTKTADGRYYFSSGNIAKNSLREGPNRAINDVSYALERMIADRQKEQGGFAAAIG